MFVFDKQNMFHFNKIKKERKRKIESGVSLIELMLAIGVFVISSATLAHLYVGSQLLTSYNLDKTQAIFLARQGIEEVRAIRNNNFENIEEKKEVEIVSLNGKEFTRTVETSFYYTDRVEVDVLVEWQSAGREEAISLVEFITKWETE
jgi:Tfp pilus assembly protein PilV